jgi:excisionase family DNA binding protein
MTTMALTDRSVDGTLLMTIPELANTLRVDRATVYRLLQRGRLPIPILRLGDKSPRVRRSDVESYLAQLADDHTVSEIVASGGRGSRRNSAPARG